MGNKFNKRRTSNGALPESLPPVVSSKTETNPLLILANAFAQIEQELAAQGGELTNLKIHTAFHNAALKCSDETLQEILARTGKWARTGRRPSSWFLTYPDDVPREIIDIIGESENGSLEDFAAGCKAAAGYLKLLAANG